MNRRRQLVDRRRGWLFVAACAATMSFSVLSISIADAALSDYENFNFESVKAELSGVQAGAHSDVTTEFALNGDPARNDVFGQPFPWGNMRNLSVELPPGLTGDPQAYPTCRADVFSAAFATNGLDFEHEQCPTDSQVGVVYPGLWNFFPQGAIAEPLYNLESPGGNVVARLGFDAAFYPLFIDIELDPRREYGLTATLEDAPSTAAVIHSSAVVVWADPSDPSHDSLRMTPQETLACGGACEPHASGLNATAFMSNPTSCGSKEVGFAADNYALPGRVVTGSAPLPDITGCNSVPFEPTMSLAPTSRRADSPGGMDVNLELPQGGLTDAKGLRTSDLRDARVVLPPGVSLNASAADGLEGCSEAQVGVVSTSPLRFSSNEATCPDASKVGTVKIDTPSLADPLEGSLYIAKQKENPFNSLLAGYIVAKGKGVVIKQAARFELDGGTGQVTAIVENAPQQPFSDLKMHFKGGARGVLRMPSSCGTFAISYELTPWSGNAPAAGTNSFTIDEGCDKGGFNPKLNAGVTNPVGGAYSPFSFDVSREDGEQDIASLDVTLPKGETAKIAGVQLCPDADAASGSCPAGSQIGTVNAAVGSGALPLWVPQAGREATAVYLAGPYEGSPYSVVAKVPAQAGPFDLGVVTVRSGIHVDEESAQVTVKSDPLPQILQGIPISYRRIHVDVDRPRFALNPTNCEETSVRANIASTGGAKATPSDRFQVGGCRELRFKPRLSLRLTGGTRRGAFPRLRAVLKMGKNEANVAKAQVALPHSEFLENAHFDTICTRTQFAAKQCPAGSIYGHARAFTPLLDVPLEGPVYLRSSDNKLPDIVADLHGQIHVVLDGRVDSVHGGIRATFGSVPDAPVTRFVLSMRGGGKGLFVNSIDLCRREHRASAHFVGQNGIVADLHPLIVNECG